MSERFCALCGVQLKFFNTPIFGDKTICMNCTSEKAKEKLRQLKEESRRAKEEKQSEEDLASLQVENRKITLTTQVIAPTSPEEVQVSELLKEATKYKKQKDYKKAIDTFLHARKLIPSSGVCYGIDIYFRLPAYLIADNRPDEALEEYKKLLNRYLPNQKQTSDFILSNNSAIYSALSRFYFKSDPVLSACYELASHINHIISIKLRRISWAFENYLKKASLKQIVRDVLGKTNLIEYYDAVFKLFTEYSKKRTFDFDEFSAEFNSIIKGP